MTEEWRTIPEYAGMYEASSLGRVRSIGRRRMARDGRLFTHLGKILSLTEPQGARYKTVGLSVGGQTSTKSVHALVCAAFHGPPQSGQWVRHLSGDSLDNRPENLAWGTPAENMRDQVRHGTRITAAKMAHAKLNADKVRLIRRHCQNGLSQTAIAREIGVSQTTVWFVLKGRAWEHVR